MNIRQEITFLSGVKDGNKNKKGLGSMSKRGRMGMRALKRFLRSQKFHCRCLLFLHVTGVTTLIQQYFAKYLWVRTAVDPISFN